MNSMSPIKILFHALALLLLGSCTLQDPSYDSLMLPQVEAWQAVLSGLITDLNGNPISGARVIVDGQMSAITDPSGVYSLEIPGPGEYAVSAEAEGFFDTGAIITAPGGTVLLSAQCSLVMLEKHEVHFAGEGTLQLQNLQIVATNFTPGRSFTLRTLPATEKDMFVCFELVQDEGAEGAVLGISTNLEPSTLEHVTIKKYVGDRWEEADCSHATPGRYALFLPVEATMTEQEEAIPTEPGNVTTLYSLSSVSISEVTYSFSLGGRFSPDGKSDQLSYILAEIAKRGHGATTVTRQERAPVNIFIPRGIGLRTIALQTFYDWEYSYGSYRVAVRSYGAARIYFENYHREDFAGGSY